MAHLVTREHAQEILDNVDNFLFDCDGVLWDGKGPIEGSLDTILKLKKLGKKVFYVTNSSHGSRADYVKKCSKWGFPAEEKDIVCTAYVSAEYLKSIGFKGKVYLVGKDESIGKELKDAGISYAGPGPDPLLSHNVEDWLETQLDPEINCVLVGFDPHINYLKILKAASYLKDPNCLFIVTNEDSCYPTKNKITVPGTGCISAPIQHASERQPVIMGKPETNMFDMLSKVHDLNPSRCMMVGDRDDTDIMFSKRVGMNYSLLVLTGVAKKEEVESGKSTPKFYAPCLGDFGKFL